MGHNQILVTVLNYSSSEVQDTSLMINLSKAGKILIAFRMLSEMVFHCWTTPGSILSSVTDSRPDSQYGSHCALCCHFPAYKMCYLHWSPYRVLWVYWLSDTNCCNCAVFLKMQLSIILFSRLHFSHSVRWLDFSCSFYGWFKLLPEFLDLQLNSVTL